MEEVVEVVVELDVVVEVDVVLELLPFVWFPPPGPNSSWRPGARRCE